MALVVDWGKDNNVWRAVSLLSRGGIERGNFRLSCFHLHSNWRADCQVGKPDTCAARVHCSPCETLMPVACAPPLISLLCCRRRRSRETVAPM
jgi:hypothetical protein